MHTYICFLVLAMVLASCKTRSFVAGVESDHHQDFWSQNTTKSFESPRTFLRSEIAEISEDREKKDMEGLNSLNNVFPELTVEYKAVQKDKEFCIDQKKKGLNAILPESLAAKNILVPVFRNKVSRLFITRFLKCDGRPIVLTLLSRILHL